LADFPQYQFVRLERDKEITSLVLNRPQRLNAMNVALLDEFEQALDVLAADDETRVIVIRGEGRAFSTGYDIQRDESEVGHTRDITEDYTRLDRNIQRFFKIWDHPKPVIAAVHGYCLAGATQLCVFCDITVVADNAKIGLPSIPIGGGYITPIWTPLVGPKRAKQMSFVAGSQISGAVASEWGWANYAVPEDELWANVRALASEIAKIPSEILRMKKYAINRVAEVQGFRTIAPMGAETDALLHYSAAVERLSQSIRDLGLKSAIEQFRAEGA
jgi:enoyl-CoA hydratase